MKAIRRYFAKVVRVRVNRGPMRGSHVAELGYWVPAGFLRRRDRFNIIKAVRYGTRRQCEAAVEGK
jgi:hypothetical protein